MKEIKTAPETIPIPSKDDTDDQWSSLTPVDLQILRELTKNAGIKQTEIREILHLSRSTASRRVKMIIDNYIESIRAQINRSRFDVVATKLFLCLESPEVPRNQIYNAFSSSSSPPFPLSIDLLEKGTISLWGRMPPSHEHNLFYTLWYHLPELQIFTMDTVGNHSQLYWFYPDNFNQETKTWKKDENYIIEGPLNELRRRLEK